MVWYVIGWIGVILIGMSVLYSGIFHSRNYAKMRLRASAEQDEFRRKFQTRLARQYMWRTIFMQCLKWTGIVVLLNLLL